MSKKENEYIGNNRRGHESGTDLSLVLTGTRLPISIFAGLLFTIITGIVAGTTFWMNISNRLDLYITINKQTNQIHQKNMIAIEQKLAELSLINKQNDKFHTKITNRIREVESGNQRLWSALKRKQ